jgi:putative sterol carrier protein
VCPQKIFDSIAQQLTDPDQNTIVVFERFIEFAVNLVNTTEELQEELIGKDFIIQMHLTDIEFDFYLRIHKGKVKYHKDFIKEATLKVELTKNQMIQMIKGELKAIDGFMKGTLKAYGSLGHGLLFIKIFRLIIRYLNGKKSK